MSFYRSLRIRFVALIACAALTMGFVSSMEESEAIATTNNNFAFEFYDKINGGEGNLFYSPFSISTALAMTYAGSDSTTRDEIRRVMHFGPNTAEFHRSYGSYYQALMPDGESKVELNIANRIWIQDRLQVERDFSTITSRYYNAKAEGANFRIKPEEERVRINKWVEEQTRDRIKNLLKPGVINGDTRMVLTNAIYFKADWESRFEEENTKRERFWTSKNRSVKHPLMHMEAGVNFYQNSDFKLMSLPYNDDKYAMVMLLPTKKAGLADLEQELDWKEVSGLMWQNLNNGYRQNVKITMPRFKFDAEVDASGILRDMGMQISFSKNANFSNMTVQERLKISKVVHKAFIEVNEEGSEAAAATAVVMAEIVSAGRPKRVPLEFKADHPFLFFIVDREMQSILFMGRMSDPSKAI